MHVRRASHRGARPLNCGVMRHYSKRTRMRWAKYSAAIALFVAHAVCADDVQALFKGAVSEIGAASRVPIQLPTLIPESIAQYGVKRVFGARTDDGYTVSLYYSEEASNASFAAMISGSTNTFDSFPNTVSVQLANGARALFRPVQCGGSCAPANLWWQVDGVQYQVQVKLPSQLDHEAQKQLLVEMANSMSLVR
jgi:hypothetical protein